jgi:hypothetical protein
MSHGQIRSPVAIKSLNSRALWLWIDVVASPSLSLPTFPTLLERCWGEACSPSSAFKRPTISTVTPPGWERFWNTVIVSTRSLITSGASLRSCARRTPLSISLQSRRKSQADRDGPFSEVSASKGQVCFAPMTGHRRRGRLGLQSANGANGRAPSRETGCFFFSKVMLFRCAVFLTRARCRNGKERGEELR